VTPGERLVALVQARVRRRHWGRVKEGLRVAAVRAGRLLVPEHAYVGDRRVDLVLGELWEHARTASALTGETPADWIARHFQKGARS
jgi:hypothetical protein